MLGHKCRNIAGEVRRIPELINPLDQCITDTIQVCIGTVKKRDEYAHLAGMVHLMQILHNSIAELIMIFIDQNDQIDTLLAITINSEPYSFLLARSTTHSTTQIVRV
jgi:hypothetical protein